MALDWFVRRGRGLTAAEEAQFQAWIAADPKNASAFAGWQSDWQALDALPEDGIEALRRGIAQEKALAQALASRQAPDARTDWRARCRAWWGRGPGVGAHRAGVHGFGVHAAALALGLVLVVGVSWALWQRPDYAQDFSTARGQQLEETLPDGSKLRLDTDTQVAVVFRHGRRDVHLTDGQVYLEVTHDAEHPFDVLAGPMRVTDLGTRFSVRYTPEIPGNDGVRVAVESGRVRVQPASLPAPTPPLSEAADGVSVILMAGQQVASDASGKLGEVFAVPGGQVATWRDNRVSFDNAPLAQVLAEFNRYGATHMQAAPNVAALGITGTFNPRKLENFTRTLPEVLPVRVRQHGDVTEIVASNR